VNARTCAQNVRELNLEQGYCTVSRTTLPHEIEMIRASGAKKVFAEWIDLGVVFKEIRSERTKLKQYSSNEAIANAKHPFLPLVLQTSTGMRPYVVGENIPESANVIGLEFQVLASEAPFALLESK
jgi:hypothetical protein